MESNNLVQERRRSPRINTDLFLQLREISKEGSVRGSICKNISGVGLNVIAFDFFPVDKKLVLELFSKNHTLFFKAIGRVVWVQQVPYQEKFRMGIALVGVTKEQCEQINDLVSKRMVSSISHFAGVKDESKRLFN